jgi:GT2 family glycosyltransferase
LKPELSIIVVSYNVRDLLLNCIKSIIDTAASIDYEIIIVDNGSNDGSAAAVREAFPEIQVIPNRENLGFASANNQGYAVSKGNFLL